MTKSDVPIPVKESTRELKRHLRSEVIAGTYSIGESIVRQTFTCLELDGTELRKKTYQVAGRKFSIQHVKDTMKLQRPYYRVKPNKFYEDLDDETLKKELARIGETGNADDLKRFHRHRTIMCWHDTSGIINSSHFLIMFTTVYDTALFLTDDEFFEIAVNINV